ncbi:AraC family transcriptional regulator [Gluconacetobacter sacchari DSM 12717]|uniref:GlxA family transcriptional regulator n=2 Tax=Gluconacetobacter sacchari TaxID=92759 RepID=A0A7W4IDI8_9PROT|nr:GlxA family transcriptional regulator [Gluconacetobacter sacchari]MBB2160759.1 GlxA family transcriptional regulator [Gluconacetobacter sacchari]GBQ29183.1 AraC family transcriptional regulator [Gluconacetobacter sacchari DSM 12717]
MTCRIGFLLIPRFSALGFLCAAEPLRVANRLAGQALYQWDILSLDGGPVMASNAMRMEAARPLADAVRADAPSLDWLVVCAGFSPLAGPARAHDRTLRALARRGTQLGGIDTGAFLLARAGVGRDTPMTMHWEARPAFVEAFPDWIASEELFEDHGAIFTCAGGTASIDLMLARIADLRGARFARRVSEQFIHTIIRRSGAAQKAPQRGRSVAHNRRLARVVALMEQTTDRRLDIGELAAIAHCSARHLERVFLQAFGRGMVAHHRGLRLARARTMLRETDLMVTEIAAATGFESRSSFSRAYRDAFGMPPAADRVEP